MKDILNQNFMYIENYEVLVIDDETGVVIAKDNIDSGSIDVKVDAKEIRAGKNNSVIATIGGSRDITVKFEEPVFNLETLAMQLGQNVIDEGAGIGYAMPNEYTVETSLKITLEHEPIEGTIKFEDKGITATVTSGSKQITISGAGVAVGDTIKVITYQYVTSEKTQTINIGAGNFATAKRVILSQDAYTTEGVLLGTTQFIFPKAKLSGNFQLDAKGGDASKNAMEFKVIGNKNDLGKVVFMPTEVGAELRVSDKILVSQQTKLGKK